jgi:mRNA-degrading endonuclease YafQ of YafQ-DinJ toxin-antitoxin module
VTFQVHIHRDAKKALLKAPTKIKKKVARLVEHLINSGTKSVPFPIATLKGEFKKNKYLEAKIDKDYRIIFRKENDSYFIRAAGTHNSLHTG